MDRDPRLDEDAHNTLSAVSPRVFVPFPAGVNSIPRATDSSVSLGLLDVTLLPPDVSPDAGATSDLRWPPSLSLRFSIAAAGAE